MDKSIEKNIQRIKRFSLSCTLNDNGHLRHFHNGHEYVEIGGIKWATCNVGAEKPTDSGLYFAWGETNGFTAEQVMNGEKDFNWDFYKYGNRSPFLKYNAADDKIVLDLEDDAVHVNMGNGWRMPTTEEFQALGNAVNTAWTKVNNVYGMLCTDKKDSSKTLFFPNAGLCANDSVNYVGFHGYYWSSSFNSSYVSDARLLYFNPNGSVYWGGYYFRSYGFAVRGVVLE